MSRFIWWIGGAGFSEHPDIVGEVSQVLDCVARNRALSLRDLQRVISLLSVSLAFTGPRYLRTPALLTGLAVLKVHSPALFRKAQTGELTYREAASFFGFKGSYEIEDQPLESMDHWWGAILSDSRNEAEDVYYNSLHSYRIRPERAIEILANRTIGRLQPR